MSWPSPSWALEPGNWIPDPLLDQASDVIRIEHLDGVDWMNAPLPRRWHRCRPQSRMWEPKWGVLYRCACGASTDTEGLAHEWWDHRNSRRRGEFARRLFRIPPRREP
jgi:hypothetical protein